MNPYKLLVLDIDGTLLDKNGAISAEDRNALARVCDLGVPVSLSTGRVVKACSGIISQLSLDSYHIFFDGALVSNPNHGKEIYVQPIDKMVVKQAIEFAHLNGINLEFYSANHYFVERETWASDIRRDFYHTPPIAVDISKLWQKERIIKGVLTVRSPEERAKAEILYLQFKDSLSFSWTKTPAYPEVDFINVLAPEVSKGEALRALAVMRPKLRVFVFPIPVPIPLWSAVIGGFLIISLFPHIAWQAHLGGLVSGLIAGYFFRKREHFFF
ncbi:HMP-PP phosphatase [subsurface metagenome]